MAHSVVTKLFSILTSQDKSSWSRVNGYVQLLHQVLRHPKMLHGLRHRWIHLHCAWVQSCQWAGFSHVHFVFLLSIHQPPHQSVLCSITHLISTNICEDVNVETYTSGERLPDLNCPWPSEPRAGLRLWGALGTNILWRPITHIHWCTYALKSGWTEWGAKGAENRDAAGVEGVGKGEGFPSPAN